MHGLGRHRNTLDAEGRRPQSLALSQLGTVGATKDDILFAQISDSHIGFNKEADKDETATLREAVAKLNALPRRPAFVLHTGDISQRVSVAGARHQSAVRPPLHECGDLRVLLLYSPEDDRTGRRDLNPLVRSERSSG